MNETIQQSLEGEWWICFVGLVVIANNQGSYIKWNIKNLGWRWLITSKRKFSYKFFKASIDNHQQLSQFADKKHHANAPSDTIDFEFDGQPARAREKKDISYEIAI